MKRILAVLLALVLSTAATVTYSQPVEHTLPYVQKFLSQCSGFRLSQTDQRAEALAFFTCLGRMRGFVDGHEVSMYLYNEHLGDLPKSRKNDRKLKRLWCVPVQMPTANAFAAVLTWVAENEEAVTVITEGDIPPTEASLAVMLAALKQLFPCTEV